VSLGTAGPVAGSQRRGRVAVAPPELLARVLQDRKELVAEIRDRHAKDVEAVGEEAAWEALSTLDRLLPLPPNRLIHHMAQMWMQPEPDHSSKERGHLLRSILKTLTGVQLRLLCAMAALPVLPSRTTQSRAMRGTLLIAVRRYAESTPRDLWPALVLTRSAGWEDPSGQTALSTSLVAPPNNEECGSPSSNNMEQGVFQKSDNMEHGVFHNSPPVDPLASRVPGPHQAPGNAGMVSPSPHSLSGVWCDALGEGETLPLGITLPCGASSTRRCPQPPWTVDGPEYKGEQICTVLSVEKAGSGYRALCHHAGDTTNAEGQGPMPDRGAYYRSASEVMIVAPEQQMRVDSLIARLEADDGQQKQKQKMSAFRSLADTPPTEDRPNSPGEWLGLVDKHGDPIPAAAVTQDLGSPERVGGLIAPFAPASPPRRATSATRKNGSGRRSATLAAAASPLRPRSRLTSPIVAPRRQLTFDPAIDATHHAAVIPTDMTQPAERTLSEDWRQNRSAVLADLDASTRPAFLSAMTVVLEAYRLHSSTGDWSACARILRILLDYPALAMRVGTPKERRVYFQQAGEAARQMLHAITMTAPVVSAEPDAA
jgi:hypothetical protein